MLIAIDGSSKRNGKPDCNAAGSTYIRDKGVISNRHEFGSTNQRGELMGAIGGLVAVSALCDEDSNPIIVTDSEYVFNIIYKGWSYGWDRKGWVNADNEPLKNVDLLKELHQMLKTLDEKDIEVTIFHVKGHLVSLGEVTGRKLLEQDPTGALLYNAASEKYEIRKDTHPHLFEKAYEVFERFNGDMVPEETFKELVLCNTVADYAASTYMHKVDTAYHAVKAE